MQLNINLQDTSVDLVVQGIESYVGKDFIIIPVSARLRGQETKREYIKASLTRILKELLIVAERNRATKVYTDSVNAVPPPAPNAIPSDIIEVL
jgi:hypothetical protein